MICAGGAITTYAREYDRKTVDFHLSMFITLRRERAEFAAPDGDYPHVG
jgi:hypothetical protein